MSIYPVDLWKAGCDVEWCDRDVRKNAMPKFMLIRYLKKAGWIRKGKKIYCPEHKEQGEK